MVRKLTHDILSTVVGILIAVAGIVATALLNGVEDKKHLAAWGIVGVCGWYYKRGNNTPVFPLPG